MQTGRRRSPSVLPDFTAKVPTRVKLPQLCPRYFPPGLKTRMDQTQVYNVLWACGIICAISGIVQLVRCYSIRNQSLDFTVTLDTETRRALQKKKKNNQ